MRRQLIFAVLAVGFFIWPRAASCQTDNAIHVAQFPGSTVGAKVANAMATCSATAPTQCYLIVDAGLAPMAAGVMPTLCGNCQLIDYRTAWPGGSGGVPSLVNTASPPTNIDYTIPLISAGSPSSIFSNGILNFSLSSVGANQLNVPGTIQAYGVNPATSGQNESSPSFFWTGNYWNGTASALDSWFAENVLGSGTNPTSTLQFLHSGSPGASMIQMPALATKFSPILDPRAFGSCPADATTDCGTALLAAANSCAATAGNACKLLVPGGELSGNFNGSGVFLANGNGLPKTSGMVLEVQGNLWHNGTLVLPDQTVLECDGGAGAVNFAIGGKSCFIGLKTQTAGTMGTAVTATGSQTFTPTFTAGAASNFVCNTTRDAANPECGAITIAGIQTCSATASRNTTTNAVTYTLTGCTDSSGDSEGARIPIASLLQASGCSDSSFNTSNNGVPVFYQDWPSGIEKVTLSGAGTSATGCTVKGFDANTFETEWVTNISGSTFTAAFAHKHAASDLWGIVNVSFQEATFNQHAIIGAEINGGPGAALYTDNLAGIDLEGDSFNATGAMTSIPMEMDGTWQGIFKGDGWQTLIDRTGCSPNCSLVSYPYGIRDSQDASRNNGASGSFIPIIQSTILGGVEVDTNGMPNNAGEAPDLHFIGTTFEQTGDAAVEYDPRFGLGGTPTVIMDHVTLQDDFLGNVQNYLGSTDGYTKPLATITPTSYGSNSVGYLGKYIDPENVVWEAAGPFGTNPAATAISVPSTGVLTGGLNSSIRGDFEGANAGQAPALVPYSSLATNSLNTVVTACGAQCSTKFGPDGLTGSALEISSNASGLGTQATLGLVSESTYAGDWIVAVAQVKAGSNMANVAPSSGGGLNALFSVVTSGTDVFAGCQNGGTKCVGGGAFAFSNDPWQPGLMIATVQTGESTAHTLTFFGYSPANGGSSPNQGEDFYDWAWFYVPGPNNPAYDGHTTQQDVVRMAEEMTHGFIPSSAAPGNLYVDPNHKINWGGLVDLYNNSGQLETDQAFQANGIKSSAPGCVSATPLLHFDGTCGAATQTIASGTASLGTSAIASGTCATVVTATATGAASTDTVTVDFNADPTSLTGYGVSATGAVLEIYTYVTSNAVNFKVCNSTSGSITPSAATLNWRVVR